jgi:arginine/ornithine transport system permease protein
VIRGIPDLVLMLLIFFGGQVAVNALSDWLYARYDIDIFFNINEFFAGVITIGFIFGAYMAETFRGAFLAVERGQIEAGHAYGLSSWQIFRRILFPQMMRHALPGLGNNWLVLLKTTALVSVIGLVDMVRVAKEAAAAEQTPLPFSYPWPPSIYF